MPVMGMTSRTCIFTLSSSYFNSHTREECDFSRSKSYRGSIISIHTPVEVWQSIVLWCANHPRVSIHTLMKSVTLTVVRSHDCSDVSIHTPHESVIRLAGDADQGLLVSIHAPARGGNLKILRRLLGMPNFNSHTRKDVIPV